MPTDPIAALLDRLPAVELRCVVMSGRWRAVALVKTDMEHIGTGVGASPSEACRAALAALVVEVKA